MPNDIDPEEPERQSPARIVRLAGAAAPEPEKPGRPLRKKHSKQGSKGGSGKKRDAAAERENPSEAHPDPGPPPPLPSDLQRAASAAAGIVVPPRPPLPAPQQTSSTDAAATPPVPIPEPAVETAPSGGEDPGEEPLAAEPPVLDAEPVVESAPVVEPASVVDPAPVVVPTPAPAPQPVAQAKPLAPTAPLAEPEPTPRELPEPQATSAAASAPAAASAAPSTAPAVSGDALVLRGVTKRFGTTHAVDGIDLTIPAGTFYGLVGPNGAGKTTTLSMIAGLLEPDHGTIHVAGVDAAAHPLAAKKLMGVLPDRLRTFDRLTGRQLLYYYGVLRRLPTAVVESRTADLARAFDFEDALGRSVSDYSAGMLKKVMLAGAMIHSPRLLVLDEPFEAVDPVSSAVILDILSTYVAHGGTVILSSHGMGLVERVCSRVAVIVAGQVLAEGTVDEVRGELTLEQRFVELAGGLSDVEGIEWLHTFSD
jgi:ABC-2 type transport system ATP-binding protein